MFINQLWRWLYGGGDQAAPHTPGFIHLLLPRVQGLAAYYQCGADINADGDIEIILRKSLDMGAMEDAFQNDRFQTMDELVRAACAELRWGSKPKLGGY